MFETVLERRQRILRACPRLRAFLDLSACRVFTVRQQCAWALFMAAIGAIATAVTPASAVESAIVQMAAPGIVIERFRPDDYSVVRIEFAHAGAKAWCHVVIYHDPGTFTVKC